MTTLTHSPIVKLYKRCASGRHADCPGSFDVWSVCACACHVSATDTRPAAKTDTLHYTSFLTGEVTEHIRVSCADTVEAVAEAIAIIPPQTAGAAGYGFKGTHHNGDETETDNPGGHINTGRSLLRWTELFAPCTDHADPHFNDLNRYVKSDHAAVLVKTCAACNAATKQAMREYALSPAYARACATQVQGANYQIERLKPVYLQRA